MKKKNESQDNLTVGNLSDEVEVEEEPLVFSPVVSFPGEEIIVTAEGHSNPRGGRYCSYFFEPTDEGVRKAVFSFVSHSEMAVDENCTVDGRPALRMRYRDPLGFCATATAYGRTRAEKWYNMGTSMGLTRYFNLLREGCTKKPTGGLIKSWARQLGGSQSGLKFVDGKCQTELRCTLFELRDYQPWNVTVETAGGTVVLSVSEGKIHSQTSRSRAAAALSADKSNEGIGSRSEAVSPSGRSVVPDGETDSSSRLKEARSSFGQSLDGWTEGEGPQPCLVPAATTTDSRWDSAFSIIRKTRHRAAAIAAAASYNGFMGDERNLVRLNAIVNSLPE